MNTWCRARSVLVLWVACVLAGMAGAQPNADAELLAPVQRWLEGSFAIPATLDVDAPLRQTAAEMSAEHLQRMRAQLPLWLEQQRAELSAAGTPRALGSRLWTRVLNEFALWRVDRFDAAHDEDLLKALQSPTFCRRGGRMSYFAEFVRTWQNVPVERRAAWLAGERELLRRWGQARPGLPARPAPSVREQALAVAAAVRAGGARPDAPMPPVLATYLYVKRVPRSEAPSESHCALHQWWLTSVPEGRAAPTADAANALRYGLSYSAADLLGSALAVRQEGASAPGNGYPPQARALEVQGKVLVEMQVNVRGQLLRSSVIQRTITVPGVSGVRPVAFETLLDEASLQRVAQAKLPLPDPSKIKDGVALMRVELVWKLE